MRQYTLRTPPRKPDWFYLPPTEKQLTALQRFNAEIPEGVNRGEASGLIYQLFCDRPGRQRVWGPDWEEEALAILRAGSPFDDPVPEILFAGKCYVFTGNFDGVTRKECHEISEKLGAAVGQTVVSSTDYLVVGRKGSPNWAHGGHGRKIERAAVVRMRRGQPAIICESDWVSAVRNATS